MRSIVAKCGKLGIRLRVASQMGNTCSAGDAQRQLQRKRIQRDTERGTEREGIEGSRGTGVKEPEITRRIESERDSERGRKKEEARRDRDPNNPSRSHRTELCEPSARAGLPRRFPAVSYHVVHCQVASHRDANSVF